MDQKEWESWQIVTASSVHKWVEDEIFRLNGRGVMYYTGGKDGSYMKITNDGMLELGIYEGALPNIGEAFFTVKVQRKYPLYNNAFQTACKIGGKKFLIDLFSSDQIPQDASQIDSSQMDDLSIGL